jgi:hypothetical protein
MVIASDNMEILKVKVSWLGPPILLMSSGGCLLFFKVRGQRLLTRQDTGQTNEKKISLN